MFRSEERKVGVDQDKKLGREKSWGGPGQGDQDKDQDKGEG